MKRFISVILTAVLALGIAALPVSAEPGAIGGCDEESCQLYGFIGAESLYYSVGSGYYSHPCTWATFSSPDPEESVIELGEQFDSEGFETAVAAAEYVNGKIYGFTGYGYNEELFCMDFSDLEQGIIAPEYIGVGLEDHMVLDMAYNYANETMYFLAVNTHTGSTIDLFTVDILTGEIEFIGTVTKDGETNFFYSIAIAADGTAYVMLCGMGAINYGSGALCEVDLETAEVSDPVCITGGECFQQQSMTYDHEHGVIYWSQWSNPYTGNNKLYVIDPEAGEATELGTINGDGGCEILGLFIPYDVNTPPAPLMGDANGDGIVDTIDAALIMRHSVGLSTLPESALPVCDYNNDGVINLDDGLLVLRKAMDLI